MRPAPEILVLVGTKAQFIKTAPVLRELDRRSLAYRLVYTGQHSETFDELEAVFGTRSADDHLVPETEADSAVGLLRWAWRFWGAVLKRIRAGEWRGARWGVVHGDTASTLMSALALRFAGVPVAHIEAGLRSPALFLPFPEEIVRRVVSRLTRLHLAPDTAAAANLHAARGVVVDTGGNTLRDALGLALERVAPKDGIGGHGNYAVVSLHRSENLGHRSTLDMLLGEVVAAASVLPVRFVLHPVTRRRLQRTGWIKRLEATPGLLLLPRSDYVSFISLLIGARFLMTDGGSNQEEAAVLGIPTLLLRRVTERPDGLGQGIALSGLDPKRIGQFVATHSMARWTIGEVRGASPSAAIVESLVPRRQSAA